MVEGCVVRCVSRAIECLPIVSVDLVGLHVLRSALIIMFSHSPITKVLLVLKGMGAV